MLLVDRQLPLAGSADPAVALLAGAVAYLGYSAFDVFVPETQ